MDQLEHLENFEILNPKLITVDEDKIKFPAEAIVNHSVFAKLFKINAYDIGTQLKNLYECDATNKTYPVFKNGHRCLSNFFFADVSSDLLKYLASASAVPVGSADAEKGFSILFHTVESHRIQPKTIDEALRIRINGPPTKDGFCKQYLDNWLKNFARSDNNLVG